MGQTNIYEKATGQLIFVRIFYSWAFRTGEIQTIVQVKRRLRGGRKIKAGKMGSSSPLKINIDDSLSDVTEKV